MLQDVETARFDRAVRGGLLRGEGSARGRGFVASRLAARLGAELGFLGAVAVGVLLRCDQIGLQIIGDDEWHTLDAVRDGGFGEIASHFGAADYSIPLALWDELLSRTIGLSEMGMRMLPLAFGLAALIALPLLLRPHVGKRAADAFAWLLAISPLHVYFSRYARPYSASLCLELVAVLALWTWSARPAWRPAAVYVACASLATYFHLMAGPFVVAPFLYFALERAVRRSRARGASFAQLALLAAITAVAIALPLAVPALRDWSSISAKAGRSRFALASIVPIFQLFTGTPTHELLALFLLFAVAGVVHAIRRRMELAAYLTFLVACLALTVVATDPYVIDVPIVLARYTLPASVCLLLAAAVGAARIDAWCRERRRYWPPSVAAYALPAALLLSSPLERTHRRPSNWTNHAWYQYQYSREERLAYAQLCLVPRFSSEFYDRLAAAEPDSLAIVETPWQVPWQCCEYAYLQERHRQRVFVGLPDAIASNPRDGRPPDPTGFAFENFVPLADLDGMRRRGVTYVIFHRRFEEEMRSPPSDPPVRLKPWIARYRRWLGPPVYFDGVVTVFDIRKRRR